ncbi:small acid-soluble spore protein SspI [Paenibacillus protaetiae]|uniref:Small, acid-soluble spore protein I n=2 Tax=Paenibacillus protaetiae TaxID=2509456 RepID=A0A4P6EZE4_9BACL|nr:small acid-soluble spore protein SspI [Paenibacillus protaetiae]
MQLDLRQAITKIVQDKSSDELNDMITQSINSDEHALPGLGVLFEMIWQESSHPEKDSLVQALYSHLHAGS